MRLTWLLLLSCLLTYTGALSCQVLPANRVVNWKKAGLTAPKPTYSNRKNILDFGGDGNRTSPNDAALQNAINSLGADSGTIYFPAGTYLFQQPIQLRSGIVLRGGDASSSILHFDLGGQHHAINISGSASADTALLIATAFRGDETITVHNPSLFKAGDYVKLVDVDTALVTDDYAATHAGQILQIKEINGNNIRFNSELRRNYYLENQPKIRKLNIKTGVGIECVGIKRLDSTKSKTANIYMEYAADCWVTGVQSDTANFAHIEIANCSNAAVTGCYLQNSFSYGPNGNGYGISLEYTSSEVLIENNIFRKLRHAMLLQSGANGNVIAYNYSREAFKQESSPNNLSGDIVLHGNYPYANLIEGNVVENIIIDASHGMNGPYNTFLRNRVTNYGILMSNGSGDSSAFIGNEITGTGFLFGNYVLAGTGNFEFGNNHRGIIIPAGTNTLNDTSYYYDTIPGFWYNTPFPPIGAPIAFPSSQVPAQARFATGVAPTVCTPRYTYTFTGNGQWTDASNWLDNLVAPNIITTGSEVVIDHQPGGECLFVGEIILDKGGRMTLTSGRKLKIAK